MALELPRIHKTEEYFDMQINDTVNEIVSEYYDVLDWEEVDDATLAKIFADLNDFRDNSLSAYSVLQSGFSDLIGYIEGIQYEREDS